MYLIIAKDLEERRRALKGALKNAQLPIISYDSEHFESFLQEVETLPFLTKSKTVVLHEVDQLSKEALNQLLAYVEKPNRWISLYLTASSLPPQSKLVKKIKEVIRLKEEKSWEKEKRLADWVIQEAASAGVAMTLSTAQVFVKEIDPQLLKSELEKLICFVGERREISLDDMRAISVPIHHETLWQLGEAIFSMQSSLAIGIGKTLIEDGIALFPLLAHLRTQFHTTLKILNTSQTGGKGAVAQAFPYLKGGLLDKKIALSKKYGLTRLRQGLVYLFQTEVRAKNSGIEPTLLLEILLVKVTHDSLSIAECTWSR